jgi:putative heme-binding domain-containing protein
MPRAVDRVLGTQQVDAVVVAQLIDFAMRRSPGRADACIAAVSARLESLDLATRKRLKEELQPVIETLLADQPPTPLRFSTQLLAAKLRIANVDATEVRRRFLSDSESPAVRIQALDALVAFRDPELLDSLPGVLSAAQPALATKVLAALGRVEDAKLADVILAQYAKLAPEVQPLAIDLLMQREPWARKLLDAVLAGKLPHGVLNANHLRKILDSNDREALWAVEKAFGRVREERNPEREKVVAEMGRFLRENPGNPVAGRRVFKTLCAQCHTIYGEGGNVGPDITANGRASFDQLLSNVFDPSLVIGPQYQVTTVVTRDGRNLTGLVTEDSEQRIVVRMAGEGEEAVPRNNVKYTRVSKLSMMPEGIETLLSRQDLADLFAFLSLDKPPGDPTAKPIPGASDARAGR